MEILNIFYSTYDEFSKDIKDFENGKKERPKLELDINFYSPKIIIREELFGEKIQNKEEIATIILDLG